MKGRDGVRDRTGAMDSTGIVVRTVREQYFGMCPTNINITKYQAATTSLKRMYAAVTMERAGELDFPFTKWKITLEKDPRVEELTSS